ncbi:cytochrome d ubiquinol oxidase subunit II [Solidesulfovibrio sp. C21]|uniref:cytochrome d ubiquinol oxidase subunit II n=1 Tax=Solidesulfovibrio sp. C21 TaxID=3398613 RepID=UPI0039FCA980
MDGPMGIAEAWYWIVALLLWLYVFTDGFDLGVGFLCLHTDDEAWRDAMTETIDGVWHANQTWLVMLGGVLFGAFPLVYGTVLAALYLPAGLLLFALMARGIGLEYRAEAERKRGWSVLFGIGSVAVVLAHGFLLGGILQGMHFDGLRYTGGAFDWFSPFTVLVALTLLFLYAMFGAAWLVLKTEGALQAKARQWGARYGAAAVVMLVVVIGYVALHGNMGYLVGRPGGQGGLSPMFIGLALAAVLCAAFYFQALGKGRDGQPLGWCAAMLAFVFAAFGGSLFPVIVPPGLTAAQAASPAGMLRVMLAVIGGLMPVILFYNAYQYRVFRGKAAPENEIE